MSSSPAWLEADPPASNPEPMTTTTTLDTPPANDNNSGGLDDDEKDLPTIILYMRLANMGAAVALVAISVSNICLLKKNER